jgi:hypothetical protein
MLRQGCIEAAYEVYVLTRVRDEDASVLLLRPVCLCFYNYKDVSMLL